MKEQEKVCEINLTFIPENWDVGSTHESLLITVEVDKVPFNVEEDDVDDVIEKRALLCGVALVSVEESLESFVKHRMISLEVMDLILAEMTEVVVRYCEGKPPPPTDAGWESLI